MRENFFCGFSLLEKTPDHSYFSSLQERIGTKRLGSNFSSALNAEFKKQGLLSEVFSFVDALSDHF